ncbi:MAG: Ldh family oxidoreductase [Caldilineaceae bacterium]
MALLAIGRWCRRPNMRLPRPRRLASVWVWCVTSAYGSAGHYARMCMDAGCIGFSVQGYRNQGVPATDGGGPNPGAHLGYYGNPPICFAIPGGEEPPVVLDAATCILADNQRGPEFEALFSMIPAAFFKSIGYGAVATLMGGALTGFTLSDESWNRWPAARMGAWCSPSILPVLCPWNFLPLNPIARPAMSPATTAPCPATTAHCCPAQLKRRSRKASRRGHSLRRDGTGQSAGSQRTARRATAVD